MSEVNASQNTNAMTAINGNTLPAEMMDLALMMEQDSGKGTEEADSSSLSIPTLYLVQSQSKALQDTTNPNARAGTIYNNNSGEFYQTVDIIVCHYHRNYVAYSNKDGSYIGTFKAVDVETNHVPNAQISRAGFDFVLNTQEGPANLTDTRLFYVLFRANDGETWAPAVIRLSRTQIKAAKRLMTQIKTTEFKAPDGHFFTPASWAVIYTASAVAQSNERGRWFGWSFARNGVVQQRELYLKGQAYYNSIAQNEIVATEPDTDFEAGSFQAREQGNQQQQMRAEPQGFSSFQQSNVDYSKPAPDYQQQSYHSYNEPSYGDNSAF